jgi:hypothetical protein
MLNIQVLVDDAKCFKEVRKLRWPEEVPKLRFTRSNHAKLSQHQPNQQCYVCQGTCCAQFLEGVAARSS